MSKHLIIVILIVYLVSTTPAEFEAKYEVRE